MNLSPRHFIVYITVLVGISLSVFSASALGQSTAIGEYINPLNLDDCLEIDTNGTCYMEIMGQNVGITGRWKVDNRRISLLFPDGTTFRGTVKTDAILLDGFGMLPMVWVKPTKNLPRIVALAGKYINEDRPDEYLVLNADGTCTKTESGIDRLLTYSGQWELDNHAVLLHLEYWQATFNKWQSAGTRFASVLENRLYFTGLFGTDIYVGEPHEEPTIEEIRPVETSPKPEEQVVPSEEPPGVEWEKTFDTGSTDWGIGVQELSDGGYVILALTAPETDSGSSYERPLPITWLVKTNKFGDVEWDRRFSERKAFGNSIQQTRDSGLILLGTTLETPDSDLGADAWLAKLDHSGNIEWERTFNGPKEYEHYDDLPSMVQETDDQGYIFVGEANSADIWLVKMDRLGKKEWERFFGREDVVDKGVACQQTRDGGYIVVGESWNHRGVEPRESAEDIWLIKTNRYGQKEWEKFFDGKSTDSVGCVQQTDDGYIIAGSTETPGRGWDFSLWLIKTDSSGDEQWNRTYGRVLERAPAWVSETRDGGYIVCTTSYDSESGTALWLLKTDASGNEQWTKSFGKNAAGAIVQQTNDGGYIVVGADLTGRGTGDVWLIKLKGAEAAPQKEELDCAIELRKKDSSTSINTIDAGQVFDIYVGASSDDGKIVGVRFLADEQQDGTATGQWTKWYDWDVSYDADYWNAPNKAKSWIFGDKGAREVWVELNNSAGQSAQCHVNIDVTEPIRETHPIPIALIRHYLSKAGVLFQYWDTLFPSRFYETGEEITFDATWSFGGQDISYTWDFGDGSPNATGVVRKHVYERVGAYQVTLFMVNEYGEKNEIGVNVYISPAVPSSLSAFVTQTENLLNGEVLNSGVKIAQAYDAFRADIGDDIADLCLHFLLGVAQLDGIVQVDIGAFAPLQRVALQELKWTVGSLMEYVENEEYEFLRKLILDPYNTQELADDVAEEAIKTKMKEIQKALDQAVSSMPSGSQLAGYAADLGRRRAANQFIAEYFTGLARTSYEFHELKQADEQSWTLIAGKHLYGISTAILTGVYPPLAGVFVGTTLGEDLYRLSLDGQMVLYSLFALGKAGFTDESDFDKNVINAIADNTIAGLSRIAQGKQPEDVGGAIRSVEQTGDSYKITVVNQGAINTEYRLIVKYDQTYTTYELLPYVDRSYDLPTYTVYPQDDGWVSLGPEEETVLKIEPPEETAMLYFELLGKTEKGLYGLDSAVKLVEKEGLFKRATNWIEARLGSAAELRVFDQAGRVTGLLNGVIKEEIPNSIYFDASKTAMIFSPSDSYRYEVVGAKEGNYELDVVSSKDGKTTNFSAANMPTSAGTVHQYTIDWDALARGEQGASLEVDSEGNGSFERAFSSQDRFDGKWVSPAKLANPKGGSLLWLWIILGVVAVIIITIATVITIKRKSSWITLSS